MSSRPRIKRTAKLGGRVHLPGRSPAIAASERPEAVLPCATREMLNDLQVERQHRRDIERRIVDGAERRAYIGQLVGTLVIAATIALSFVAIFTGHEFAGVMALVAVFSSAAPVRIITR
jgi:hypothetical protein